MSAFSGQRWAVVGLGKSGLGACRLLSALGATVEAFDESAQAPALEGVRFHLGPLRAGFHAGFRGVVVSPGVPLAKPELVAAAKEVEVIGEIALAMRALPPGAGPCLGVTGTNGKSTTTALLGALVAAWAKETFVGGNLGTPLSEAALRRERPYAWHVVELSSFQLEGLSEGGLLGAAFLNLTPDHLDRYPSHEAYGEAKARIFVNQPKRGFAVVNADDEHVVRLSKRASVPLYGFSASGKDSSVGFTGMARPDGHGGFTLEGGQLSGRESYTLQNRALRGAHNLANAMAAAWMARLAGAPEQVVREGLARFPGLPHRLELVRELDGVEWINDSKATNVDSSLVALAALEAPLWLIAGGKGKGAPYAPLVEASANKLRGVLTVGDDAPKIAQAFEGTCPVISCGTIEAAVKVARQRAVAGDAVLLSPACASYDQFKNFEHRGDTFKALVRSL